MGFKWLRIGKKQYHFPMLGMRTIAQIGVLWGIVFIVLAALINCFIRYSLLSRSVGVGIIVGFEAGFFLLIPVHKVLTGTMFSPIPSWPLPLKIGYRFIDLAFFFQCCLVGVLVLAIGNQISNLSLFVCMLGVLLFALSDKLLRKLSSGKSFYYHLSWLEFCLFCPWLMLPILVAGFCLELTCGASMCAS